MPRHFLSLLITLLLAAAAIAQDLRLDITRDTWVSAYRGETDGNNGSDSRLKTKGIVELSLLDFDPSPMRGRVIQAATLHIKPASNDHQKRVTLSTISADWAEGDGRRYAKTPGSASFNWAKQDQSPWAWPGSDITAVIGGMGNSLWAMTDATAPDANGFQHVAVLPAVIAANIADLSDGVALIDDVGSEYTHQGNKFTHHLFPNRFLHSRQAAAANRPYLTITLGQADALPPGPITNFTATTQNLPTGHCAISWTTPADPGPAGTMGFIVTCATAADGQETLAQRVPRYLIPLAGKPGERVSTTLRDLPMDFSTPVTLYIRAVDAAGNAGPITRHVIPARQEIASLDLPNPPAMFPQQGPLPELDDGSRVFIVDALDKINPVTAQMIPSQEPAYILGNHLWSAADRTITLHAAKNEFVSFQFAVVGQAFPTALVMMDSPRIDAQVLRFAHVQTDQGPLPDPVIPPDVQDPHPVAGRQLQTGLVELYIPHDMPAGDHQGALLLSRGGKTLTLHIKLRVWNFTLPDHLSFIPQMNAYGLGGGSSELAYYRLAHRHRTTLNRLPYNWQGRVQPGGSPAERADGSFDWTAWDRRFGPLFDGSAFADLPRKGVPIEHFYLPLNENWPASIDRGFSQGYWADEALTPAYRKEFVQASRDIARHIAEKGWNDTFFEFFLNGKLVFKRSGWDSASSPWIFDEPVNTQDFWALRWYGIAFHEGVNQAFGMQPAQQRPRLAYRVDISRPQWQRDLLDGVTDINVVGGALSQYQRLVTQRQQNHREFLVHYGSSNPITKANTQPASWCIDTFLRGGQGVLPWQTIGKSSSWSKPDTQAIFYPGKPIGQSDPVPSIRLKAYTRGQQDVEYLTLLEQTTKLPRWAIEARVRELAMIDPPRIHQQGENAADIEFASTTPQSLWRMRTAVGMKLDELAPPAKDRLVDHRTPVRDVSQLPDPTLR